jgi:type IVB pilus formation R64 PilN family outer membrane protein
MQRITRFILLMLLALAACVRTGASEEDVLDRNAELGRLTRSQIVKVDSQPYMRAVKVPLAGTKSGSTSQAALPPALRRTITLNMRGTMPALAAKVSGMIGIPIRVYGSGSGAAAGVPSGASMDADLRAALGDVPGQPTSQPGQPGQPANTPASPPGIRVEYSGPVQGLLDLLSARSGLSWEYSPKSGITYAVAAVRTFAINAAPGTFAFKSKITNESEGNSTGSLAGTGGSSVQDTSLDSSITNTADLKVDVWKDIETEVKAMLTPRSGSVTLNQVAGSITVRDNPYVLSQVERYVDDLNDRLSRQIALSIKVWNLEVGDSADAGLDLGLFFESPDVRVFAGASPLRFLNAGGELSAAVVDGKLKNSTALLKGLRSLGKATQVTSGSGVIMNGMSMPVQAIRRLAYVARSEQTSTQ